MNIPRAPGLAQMMKDGAKVNIRVTMLCECARRFYCRFWLQYDVLLRLVLPTCVTLTTDHRLQNFATFHFNMIKFIHSLTWQLLLKKANFRQNIRKPCVTELTYKTVYRISTIINYDNHNEHSTAHYVTSWHFEKALPVSRSIHWWSCLVMSRSCAVVHE